MILLGSTVSLIVWFLPLAGWPENFLKIAAFIFLICSPIVYWFWPAGSSLGWAYVLVACVTIVTSFLIAYPFVTQEEAKEKARKYAEEQLHGAQSIKIADAKLDNWTWIVTGWRIEKYSQPVRFYVNVPAKHGTATNLRYTE